MLAKISMAKINASTTNFGLSFKACIGNRGGGILLGKGPTMSRLNVLAKSPKWEITVAKMTMNNSIGIGAGSFCLKRSFIQSLTSCTIRQVDTAKTMLAMLTRFITLKISS